MLPTRLSARARDDGKFHTSWLSNDGYGGWICLLARYGQILNTSVSKNWELLVYSTTVVEMAIDSGYL